jgi:arylsulfatase
MLSGGVNRRGVEAGKGTFPHTIPFALEASETFDVGSDTGTGGNPTTIRRPLPSTASSTA